MTAVEAAPGLVMIAPGVTPNGAGADVLGNKAFNLLLMAAAGLPVPPGFVLPTAWCRRFRRAASGSPARGGPLPRTEASEAARSVLADGVARLERLTGLGFGSARRPLLLSVRSGARVSMPGMMETVLDIGMNEQTVAGLIRATGNPRLAWDSYRRLVQGYAEVVAGVPAERLDGAVRAALAENDVEDERELDHVALQGLAEQLLALFADATGAAFPRDPLEQLSRAAEAVFASWDTPRATAYRAMYGIDDDAGTAVTVQTMVYGNAGGTSGAGVGFTRDPATGADELYLDFQFNAQGEDVVAGRRALVGSNRLRAVLPLIWARLEALRGELEALFGDAQDFEFTVQDGVLFLLQTRAAKRTPWAAVRIAVDLVSGGVVSPEAALGRLADIDLSRVTRTRLRAPDTAPLGRGIVASLGVASGPIALDNAAAARFHAAGTEAILVRMETTTDDVTGMADAAGLLTALGGRTSHAAVVARQLGRVCLVGCADLTLDLTARTCSIGGKTLAEGDVITLDGNEGTIHAGRLEVVTERPEAEIAVIEGWRAAVRSASV
jgi:pyruvate,orthophosphate dikinase